MRKGIEAAWKQAAKPQVAEVTNSSVSQHSGQLWSIATCAHTMMNWRRGLARLQTQRDESKMEGSVGWPGQLILSVYVKYYMVSHKNLQAVYINLKN